MSTIVFDDQTLLVYKGPFQIKVLSDIAVYIRTIVKSNFVLQKRLYKIFIELAQNVSKYSTEREVIEGIDTGKGSFILEDMSTYYKLTTTNIIKQDEAARLIRYCETIDSLNYFELRRMRSIILKNRNALDSGAHIGFIQIGLLSSKEIEPEIVKIDENYSLFILHVKLSKLQEK